MQEKVKLEQYLLRQPQKPQQAHQFPINGSSTRKLNAAT